MGLTGGVPLDHVSPFVRFGIIPEQSSAYMPGLSAGRHDCADTGADTRILPMLLAGWGGRGQDYSDIHELLAAVHDKVDADRCSSGGA